MDAQGYRRSRGGACRPGFTLAELLVTIVILSIVVMIAMRVMQAAQNAAREATTRATIAKIHQVIMRMYDSYGTRRVPVDLEACAQRAGYKRDANNNPMPIELERARVNALRDLMRMEMPDRWSDIKGPPLLLTDSAGKPVRPRISQHYMDVLNSAYRGGNPGGNEGPKCLYMVVMNNPESASLFRADEIADIDHDGMRVFVDGWGGPIGFVRWPAGFVAKNELSKKDARWAADGDLQSNDLQSATGSKQARYRFPDPLDPMGVAGASCTVSRDLSGFPGYALYPLVYSAGPDRKFDINVGKSGGGSGYYNYRLDGKGDLDPYTKDGQGLQIGQPVNLDDRSEPPRHFDNVHNHRLEVR